MFNIYSLMNMEFSREILFTSLHLKVIQHMENGINEF